MKPTFDNLPNITASLVERVRALEALLRQILEKEPGNGSIDPLLTINEVSAILKRSRQSLYQIPRKDLPFFHIGSDKRYRKKDVEKYIANKIKSTEI